MSNTRKAFTCTAWAGAVAFIAACNAYDRSVLPSCNSGALCVAPVR